MKSKIDSSILIKKYIEYATIEGETKLNGDYKKGNEMVKKLNKIFKIINENEDLAKEVISAVLYSNSIRAQGLAAVDALRLNIYVNDAINILEKISLREDIWGFGSEMALKIWRGEIPGKSL